MTNDYRPTNKCFEQLPEDEQNEDEGIFTVGNSLAFQFYCGNWSHTVKEMKEMQKEVNYLRSRVVKLNDLLVEQQKHTTNSIEYLQDSIDDMQMDLDLR